MSFTKRPDKRDTLSGMTPNKAIKRPTNPPVKRIIRSQGK